MEDGRDSRRVPWRVSATIDGDRRVDVWDISTTGIRVWGIQTSKGQRHKIDLPRPESEEDETQQFEVETVWCSGVMVGMRFLFETGEQRSAIWDLRTLVMRGKI